MAVRTTTLGLENLESRLNLSSLVGAAVVDSFTSALRSQERATLRNHTRLINLNSETGIARKAGATKAAAKPAVTIPLVASHTDSAAPSLSLSPTTKAITLLWTNNALNPTGFRIERSTDGINFTSIATTSPTRTSFTDTKVVAGTDYTYRVTVFNKNNSLTGNTSTTALIPPPPPVAASLLTDTKNSLSSVTLAWHDNANNETGYQIYRSTAGSDFTLLTTLKANSKSFTDTSLNSATQYVYEIAAVNAGGQSFANGNLTATTLTPPLAAPINLTSSNINSSAVTLAWTDASTNLSGFRVYRSSNGSPFTLIGNVESNTNTFTDTNLSASTKYTYEVSAWNATANEFSHSLAATTLAAAPNAPSNPAFTNVTTTSLTLNWTPTSTNQTGYHIYRSDDGTNFTLVGTTGTNDFAFNDQALAAGTTYWYNVAAYNAGGESSSTTILTTTVADNVTNQSAQSPSTPANLSFANVSTSTLALNWTEENTAAATGIHIYRSTNGGSFTLADTLDPTATTWNDSSLATNTQYSYEVAAFNASTQVTSAAASVSTLNVAPNTPSAPTFTAVTTSSVTLNWTESNSSNATGIHIYRAAPGGDFTLVATLASTATTWTNNTLNTATQYSYKVAAFNATGESASSAASVSTLNVAPNTPSAPTFTAVTSSSVTLNWIESNSSNATGIHIYRAAPGGDYTLVATLASTDTTWTNNTLNTATQYSYKVAAFNATGESASSIASVSTLNVAPNTPSAPTFTAVTSSSVTLNWTESNSSNATGIHVYRAAPGGDYTLVATLASTDTTWTNNTLNTSTQYSYKVAAFNATGESTSSSASVSTLNVAPGAPGTLTFSAVTTSSLTLNWQNANTTNATGIHIYRAAPGESLTLVGTLAANATSWNDSSLAANTSYNYEVAAFNSAGESASAPTAVTTLLAVPNSPSTPALSAVTSSSITLNWSDTGSFTGIHVYRSTDGTNYTLVQSLSSTATTWTDTTGAASTTYYYEVGAYNSAGEAKSISAHTTTLAPPPPVNSTPVTFSTQNLTSFTELDITGTTGNDSIVVTQSNGILSIVANGLTYTYTNTYGDLKIFGVNGNDTITVQSSVNIATLIYGGNGNDTINNLTTGKATIVTIGSGTNTVTGNGVNTAFWVNTGDTVNATTAEIALGGVNRVSNFYQPFTTNTAAANYIPRSLAGQNLPDPTDSGTEIRLTHSSLWGTGASMNDINQTSIADCYFLAPLASLAFSEPQKLMNMGVDLGDGTYAFRFVRGGVTSYVRVDGDLSGGGYWTDGLVNATPGADGNEWGSLFEKAYAFYRSPNSATPNTYSSLNYGFQGSTYSDLGLTSSSAYPGTTSASTAMNLINTALAASHGVVASTNSAIVSGAPLIGAHVYTVIGAYTNSAGTVMIQLRNPWGVDGANDGSNPNDGLVTVSYSVFAANFSLLNYVNA